MSGLAAFPDDTDGGTIYQAAAAMGHPEPAPLATGGPVPDMGGLSISQLGPFLQAMAEGAPYLSPQALDAQARQPPY